MDTVSGHARLGIAVAEARRRRGFGRDALDLVARYLREVFALRKVVLEVQAENTAAISLYHSAGYTDVGIHAEHFYFDGVFHDVAVMERRL
jgi:RimJ/RimL family protein N-acetyltransferase